MATVTTATWTEDVDMGCWGDPGTKKIAASGVSQQDIDLAANGYIGVVVQLALTFGPGSDANPIIYVLGSSDSGTTDDRISLALFSQDIVYSTSGTSTFSIPIMDMPHIQVYVRNPSATGVTVTGKYAGLKYTNT